MDNSNQKPSLAPWTSLQDSQHPFQSDPPVWQINSHVRQAAALESLLAEHQQRQDALLAAAGTQNDMQKETHPKTTNGLPPEAD